MYHRTHGIVYNSNEVYCVVWKPGSSTTVSQLRQYLQVIGIRAGGSPVILVETHADTGAASLDVTALLEEFKDQVGLCGCSA